MEQKITDPSDEFAHGGMGRRSFLDRLAQAVGGTAAVAALLPFLQNNDVLAQTIAESDNRLEHRITKICWEQRAPCSSSPRLCERCA